MFDIEIGSINSISYDNEDFLIGMKSFCQNKKENFEPYTFQIEFAGILLDTTSYSINSLGKEEQINGENLTLRIPQRLYPGITLEKMRNLLKVYVSRDGEKQQFFDNVQKIETYKSTYSDIVKSYCNNELQFLNKEEIKNLKKEDILANGLFTQHLRSLHVEWNLTDMCNYNCSYCGGWVKPLNKKNFPSREKIDNALNNIFSLKRTRYTFTLLGGEPTVHPDFLYILEKIHSYDSNVYSYTVTNAGRSINFFNQYAEIMHGKAHDVVISFHPQYAHCEDILNKVKILSDAGLFVSLHYMIYIGSPGKEKEYWDKFITLNEKVLQLRNKLAFQYDPNFIIDYKQGCYDKRYEEWQFQKVQNIILEFNKIKNPSCILPKFPHGGSIYKVNLNGKFYKFNADIMPYMDRMRNGFREYKNFYCLGGSNFILINPDGSIEPTKCQSHYNTGLNIYTQNINIKEALKLIECTQNTCESHSSDCIPKFKDKTEALYFLEHF